jgi:regulatory protein
LNSRDVAPEVIAEELEALEGSGLIDDEALARELVEKYAIRGGLGRRGVMEKLRARKIPDHIIENALRMVTPEDETSALRELAISKLRSVESLAPNVARRRLGAFLLRKGYSPGEVYPLVSDLIR